MGSGSGSGSGCGGADRSIVGDIEGTLDIVLKYYDQGLTVNIHPEDTNQPYLRQGVGCSSSSSSSS